MEHDSGLIQPWIHLRTISVFFVQLLSSIVNALQSGLLFHHKWDSKDTVNGIGKREGNLPTSDCAFVYGCEVRKMKSYDTNIVIVVK